MTGMDWSNIDQALAHQHSLLKEAEKFHQANAGIRAARAARSNRAGARRDRRLRAQPASLRPGVAPQGAQGSPGARGAHETRGAQWRVMVREVGSALVSLGQRLEAVGR